MMLEQPHEMKWESEGGGGVAPIRWRSPQPTTRLRRFPGFRDGGEATMTSILSAMDTVGN